MTKQALIEKSNNPMTLIASAVANDANVETLGRLMALQERYESNEARKAFIAAMQKFQALKPILPQTKEVKHGQKVIYKFCPLPVIEKTLKPILEECDLFYRFENLNKDGAFGVRCIVTHVLGHSESSEMYGPADDSGAKNQIMIEGPMVYQNRHWPGKRSSRMPEVE